MTEIVRDQFGYEIQRGDILTYPVRQSSSLWMTCGVVKEVVTKKDECFDRTVYAIKLAIVSTKNWDDDTLVVRNTTMSSPERATVVHQYILENMPEDGYFNVNRHIMAGLRQIRKIIMENGNVPKELPDLPSGSDNGSVV